MKTLHAPSASLVAVQNGAPFFEHYAGTARLHEQVPPTADDGFLIASNSKVQGPWFRETCNCNVFTSFVTL